MIRIVVAEDEGALLKSLCVRIARLWPEANIVAQCRDGHAALEAIQELRPEVAFLDIKMGSLSGVDIPNKIEHACEIVYVTAYEHYAVTAFEQGAVDYLLKPISDQRLKQCIDRLKRKLSSENEKELESERFLTCLPLNVGTRMWNQPVSEILFLRASGRYVEVVTAQRNALVRTPLISLLSQLNPKQFLQIHRSIVVNISHVEHIEMHHHKPVVFLKQAKDPLPIGRNFRTHLKNVITGSV